MNDAEGRGGNMYRFISQEKQDYNRTEAARCQGNGLFSRHQDLATNRASRWCS